jgi:glycerol-3-phosphate cytidylyltransferase
MIFNKIKELKADGKKVGITFSTFDMLHAGHVAMLSEAKNHCDYLICGLQTDPTIDRPDTKNKPVQSIVERQIQLASCRYVDEVVVYATEQDLIDLLLILPVDVRILGVEYENKDFSGRDECYDRNIEIVFNSRDHSFSSSSLRKRVVHSETERLLKNEPDLEEHKDKLGSSLPTWR